ncbi:thioredoxin domain-containing protein [Enterococcus hirae]|nr:thioredoxin domain-containing protein [Enterococcus hirae]
MDISVIKKENVNTDHGILVGKETAPITMIEFLNVRCPYCKKWFLEHFEYLHVYVHDGQLKRLFKFFNKDKHALKRGNIMHQFIPRKNDLETLFIIKQIFETQNEWGDLSDEEIEAFAMNQLHLEKQADDGMAQAIIDEAREANIQFVPTVLVGDQIFDEHVTAQELQQLLK